MDRERFIYLFQQYLHKRYSTEERTEFLRYLKMPGYLELLEQISEHEIVPYALAPIINEVRANEVLGVIEKTQVRSVTTYQSVHRVHFLRTAWFRYAAAIIILFGVAAYYYISLRPVEPLITQTKPVPTQNDIAPGYSRATLTLSDGKTVELNKNATEKINDGKLSIDHTNGELIYRSNTITAMNTMTTPKGGQYQLTLSDGTKVWLNAASSITYPTAFTNNNREVSITGEVYFEVKKNASKPFVVKTISDEIQVLGTSFNINAYNDAPVKTSLLEGKVKVQQAILKPGQAYSAGQIISTNLEQDIAWKNGYFNFEGAKLETVMLQLARWYDLNIEYEKGIPAITFFGELTRNVSLNNVLKMLEGAGVHFTLTGNTLRVKP